MRKLTIEGVVASIFLIILFVFSLSFLPKDGNYELFEKLSSFKDSEVFIVLLIIYITPSYFLLVGINYLVNFIFKNVKERTLLWKFKKGINSLHTIVTTVPFLFGFPLFLIGFIISAKIQKIQSNINRGSLFNIYNKKFGEVFSIVLFTAFKNGLLGDIARKIVFFSFYLYIPLCIIIVGLIIYVRYFKKRKQINI